MLGQASAARAQTTTMPSTLRYGSGLIDVPVASVLPHLEITGTYSGSFVRLDRTVEVNPFGVTTAYGPPRREYYQDGSVAVGLFDRAEVGATVQSLGDAADGGDIWGFFGRVQLLRPAAQGLALAVGGRWVASPRFGGGADYEPNRLGFPDPRFRHSWVGLPNVDTNLTLYGVASAHVRGYDGGFLPENDLTFTLGYGSGMFKAGSDLSFYSQTSTNGWFFGSAVHMRTGAASVLTVMGEYNGFDVNLGAQLDVKGVRIGAEYLAANYGRPTGGYYSEYLRPKLGVMASLAVCPGSGGFLCKPHLMERVRQKVVQLPAPPPDTVLITRDVSSLPEGTPVSLCLATGRSVTVRVDARGDTLVGPDRVSIRTLGPSVVFSGSYAGGTDWYRSGAPVRMDGRSYGRAGEEERLDCGAIVRVGESMGVPLFAERGAEPPYGTVYVPVRPDVWRAYRAVRHPPGG